MTRVYFFIVIALCSCIHLQAQRHIETFAIVPPEQVVANSLYNKIAFIDSRDDTTNMGIVQLGAFNKKATVIAETPLPVQLSRVMMALTDSSAKNGELLFQLRQFSFAEITGASGEKGYCFIRAALYTNINNTYRELGFIDTVILIRSMDVTRALLRNGSKLITSFIASNLTEEAYGRTAYSYNEVAHIDSIEKRDMIVYNTAHFVDGFYDNYQSFTDMIPDGSITSVDMRNDKIYSIKINGANGKGDKLKAKDLYAIVYEGQPYIATAYGFYPLQKKEDNFFFTGKAEVSARAGDVAMASLFFGVMGGLIASDATATFKMKIDHLNGGFIRLEEVKN